MFGTDRVLVLIRALVGHNKNILVMTVMCVRIAELILNCSNTSLMSKEEDIDSRLAERRTTPDLECSVFSLGLSLFGGALISELV